MDIDVLILEQERNLQMSGMQAAISDLVPDPVPTAPSPSDFDPGLISEMIEMLRDAHSDVIDAFNSLPCALPQHKWQRSAVQSFMASDQIKTLESAIEQQCLVVMRESDPERRQVAFGRVEEGIVYWKRLIMWQINKGKEKE